MNWISGIGRNENGDLCVKVQALGRGQGASSASTPLVTTTLEPLEAVGAHLCITGGVRRKMRLPLHELQVGDTTTREYLDSLGLGSLEADGQPVYEHLTSTGKLVIPAQVLVLAIMGANSQFRQVLHKPWGPCSLMSVFTNKADFSLVIRKTPNRMHLRQLAHHSLATKLEWILSYPSATAAWSSIYRYALEGRFDMDMPQAVVEVVVMARQVGDKLLVTRMQLMTLTAAEEPHPFATEVAKCFFVFNESVALRPTHRKAAAPSRDERLTGSQQELGPDAVSVVPLTDEQWARVEPLVQGVIHSNGPTKLGAPRTHSVRDVVDVIRLKLGTPYSWSKVPTDRKLIHGATVLLSKLKRGGAWDAIVAAAGLSHLPEFSERPSVPLA